MDPDANLKEQRGIIERADEMEVDGDDLLRLTDLVKALDEWITKGGALPKAWQR